MSDRQEAKSAKDLFPEPPVHLDDLAHRVIGAAIEVHRHLGPGYLEAVYEEALCIELRLRRIPFDRQAAVRVFYKGQTAGEGRVDVLVGGALVVEVKALAAINEVHRAQVISYLKALQQPLGLLLNFKTWRMRDGVERIVRSLRRSTSAGQHGAGDVEESSVAVRGLVVARGDPTEAFELMKEDLHSIAQPIERFVEPAPPLSALARGYDGDEIAVIDGGQDPVIVVRAIREAGATGDEVE